MKKFILFLCCFLAALFLALCVLTLVPFSSLYEKGPKAHYRVEEGAIDVFSLRNGQIRSLLGFVTPGETFTAKTISAASLKVPFWMSWLESVTIAAVGQANLFMYKQSEKARYRNFAVAYTDESIQRGFTKEIEKMPILSNVRMNFHEDGFSFFIQIGPIPIAFRGYASTGGTSDRLFLRLRWLKLGQFFLPKHVLRILENVFLKAYIASSHHSIRLYKITFSDNKMVMWYEKEGENAVGGSLPEDPHAAPEIFYPGA
jgi:hypothetical protein